MPFQLPDQFDQEFEQGLRIGYERIPVSVFLCGKGLSPSKQKKTIRRDIRSYLERKLTREWTKCQVKLGEHMTLMRAYRNVSGTSAFNLADHEFKIAQNIDLIIVFPCSAGSIAELGMFCLEDDLAHKLVLFVNRKYNKKKSYIMEGPIKAAKRRNSRVFVVDYNKQQQIWSTVRDILLELRANKGRKQLTPNVSKTEV